MHEYIRLYSILCSKCQCLAMTGPRLAKFEKKVCPIPKICFFCLKYLVILRLLRFLQFFFLLMSGVAPLPFFPLHGSKKILNVSLF